jgi:adenylate kinase
MLREHVRDGDEIGAAITNLLRAGSLVPDALVNQMVRQRIAKDDAKRGFILDGYPRTIAQAIEMKGLLAGVEAREVVIHLVVDYNVIISRITGRRVCPVCGTVYNAKSNPPKIEGVCDLDGSSLVIREDDREDVVRERLEQYERQTKPLIEHFSGGGHRLISVDASSQTPEEVFRKIQLELIGTGLVADLASAAVR